MLFTCGDRRFGLPGRFSVVRCAACALVRTEPQPEDPAAFYPEEDYYSYAPPSPPSRLQRARIRRAYEMPTNEPTLVRALAALGARRLATGLPLGPPGAVLDVGCGSGEMLLALREAGWRVHGVELSELAVARARAAGLDDVRAGDLLEAGFATGSFDAVRFWHVLEHVRSPREQVEEARRILRPGGTLTIGVPNFSSLLSRALRDRSFYLDVPRHLWHFEPRTLARLVAESGFEVTRVRLVTTSTPILGALDLLRPRRTPLAERRRLAHALLPVAALLDALHLGDGLELAAVAPSATQASRGDRETDLEDPLDLGRGALAG